MNECKTCKFWDHFDEDNDKQELIGTCRRYPPVRIVESVAAFNAHGEKPAQIYDVRDWDQPTTFGSSWCGEHTKAG